MNTTSHTARFSAFLAAVILTTALVGSQFGLAERYNAEAEAVLAAQPAGTRVAQAQVVREAN